MGSNPGIFSSLTPTSGSSSSWLLSQTWLFAPSLPFPCHQRWLSYRRNNRWSKTSMLKNSLLSLPCRLKAQPVTWWVLCSPCCFWAVSPRLHYYYTTSYQVGSAVHSSLRKEVSISPFFSYWELPCPTWVAWCHRSNVPKVHPKSSFLFHVLFDASNRNCHLPLPLFHRTFGDASMKALYRVHIIFPFPIWLETDWD